jgi:hypothetical protein
MRRLFLLFAWVPLCVACAPPSVLIGSEDVTFARGQQRLHATTATVDALKPPEAERDLFLQAEGFYDYRFAFPRRSFVGYLAEGAAAVTDFPALQSFASSLDLADLRIGSSDGAIHLWETLLSQYPATSLRPLTLYRLGWAYRSTSARGFPRRSGDEAFALLAKEYPDSPFAPLAARAMSVPWKSKSKAASLSLVPGAGQMYEGRVGNGTVRLGFGLVSAAMVATPIYFAYERRRELQWNRDWPLLATGALGAVFISIDYTTAYQDAVQGAVRFNERTAAEFEDQHPESP